MNTSKVKGFSCLPSQLSKSQSLTIAVEKSILLVYIVINC